jgi:hypothetical protein
MKAEAETLSKPEVAKRQLTQAIWLFFEQRDAVSVHTLAAAARQVLHDLAGRSSSVITENLALRPERKSKWICIVKAAENFFKHADRDADAILTFRPQCTQFFLYDAIQLYRTVTGDLFYEAQVYLTWFSLTYPEFILDPGFRNMLEAARQQGVDGSDFGFVRFLLQSRAFAT